MANIQVGSLLAYVVAEPKPDIQVGGLFAYVVAEQRKGGQDQGIVIGNLRRVHPQVRLVNR